MSPEKRIFKRLIKGLRFIPLSDIFNHYQLIKKWNHQLIRLRIKSIGNSYIFARGGTEDYQTLYSVFYDEFHLPPINISGSPIILDLGSNVGYTIRHFLFLYPTATIIGVEMDEDNIEIAKLNIGEHRNVKLLHNAISCKDGVVCYNKSVNEDAYKITAIGDSKISDLRKVSSITLQSIISKYNLLSIDFIKMDIEGEEVNLFDKDVDLTWLKLVKSLNIEVHGDYHILNDILSTLEKYGFRAWKDTHHWSAIMAVKL